MDAFPRQLSAQSINVSLVPILSSDPPHSFSSVTFVQSEGENKDLRIVKTFDF